MDTYLTSSEVAKLVRTSPETVRYWRHIGKGPHSFKLGRKVLYLEADVRDWLKAEREARPVEGSATAEVSHGHVSLAKVLDVLQEVREASITSAEQEAVRRCERALMVLPTYARCES